MKRLIMIVEDDPATRACLGGIFSLRGWDVCLAPTVSEALTLLGHGLEPDFLVLDLGLPDGGGEAVLKAVKGAGLRTHVIVCTGMSDPPAADAGPRHAARPHNHEAHRPGRDLSALRELGRLSGPKRHKVGLSDATPLSPSEVVLHRAASLKNQRF